MQDQLVSIIQELMGDLTRIRSMDEAATQQAVVLRLLAALGWNPYNTGEVTPQFSVGPQKVDYALLLAHVPKVFIEVKRPSIVDLSSHEEQLLNYSFGRGVSLAILTNGLQWRFYLPLLPVTWPKRRFCTIDLSAGNPRAMARKFASILAKGNVASEKALSTAKRWHDSKTKESASDDALPKAWNQIIRKSDDALVQLLRETTKRVCGIRPGVRHTKRFLAQHRDQLLLPETRSKPTAGATLQPVDKTRSKRKRKQIKGFTFLGVAYTVNTWKELQTTLSGIVYEKNTKRFALVLTEPTLRGTKRKYFSRDAGELHTPGQIGDSGYFVETHVDSQRAQKICRDLLAALGYSDGDLTIQ